KRHSGHPGYGEKYYPHGENRGTAIPPATGGAGELLMHYDLEKHNFEDPNPWTALALDHSTFFEPVAREALMRNNATRSRQFFLPVIRPFAKLLIILVQLIRIILPNSLTSSRMLHGLIVWGMKKFVHPDANYLIIRHFNIGSQI